MAANSIGDSAAVGGTVLPAGAMRPSCCCLFCPWQVIKHPDDALLALLLGNAIGVMFLLSVAEMWIHK